MNYKTVKYIPLAVSTAALMPVVAKAQGTIGGVSPISPNTGTGGAFTISNFLNSFINILLFFVTFAAIIYLILSGYRYISAGGDQEKADAGRKGVINAIIGLIIIGATFFILQGAVGLGENSSIQSGTFNADTSITPTL